MPELIPNIKINNNALSRASGQSPTLSQRAEPSSPTTAPGRVRSPEMPDSTARSGSRTGKLLPNFSMSQSGAPAKSSGADARRDSQPIDPLSHQIQQRTNTPAKLRSTTARENSPAAVERSASIASGRGSIDPNAVRQDSLGEATKERKNRASFFSRFAGKKKENVISQSDTTSQTGETGAEGRETDVFSQPIGFVPQFPSPPKYIKVRSHGRRTREFGRVFLAQELRGRTGVEIAQSGGRPLQSSASLPSVAELRKDGNAIWAMEFSKDGKYLAAGGKDYVVRVWSVLATKADRQSHEQEEERSAKEGESIRLNAPVFKTRTAQEYSGHTASVLDLDWSKNNFLLSSSMDKTVRLWHVSREECLCCFKHNDFVTSIQFHPRDDRFFLAGSLDSKLRLWSIPDKSVAYWNSLPELITAVAFTPDGKTAIAGCLNGLCLFFETEGLKYQTQIHVRSAHGKNAKGSKVTGIQAVQCPPEDSNGQIKLLITSNDSRIRVYNLRDKSLDLKLKGNDNSCSQIRASFSDDLGYIICGSEDCKTYIWPTAPVETEKEKRPVEMFEAHSAIVTTAIMAPTQSRRLLSASGDPLYDLCNPPPVTLVSRTQSEQSSLPQVDDASQKGSQSANAATCETEKSTKPEGSPAYLARCAHTDGNIIVTADFDGHIKVFRQDCAYQNRLRINDSSLSKKMLGRASSVATRNSNRSQRDSFQVNNQSSDRILSWRQSINSTTGSIDGMRGSVGAGASTSGPPGHKRSISPRKSLGQLSLQSGATNSTSNHHRGSQSTRTPQNGQFPSSSTTNNSADPSNGLPSEGTSQNTISTAFQEAPASDVIGSMNIADKSANPLMLHGEQSYMFWNRTVYQAQAARAQLDHHQQQSHLHRRSLGVDGNSTDVSTTANSSNASLVAGGEGSSSGAGGVGGGRRLGVPLAREITAVSRLSSEENSIDGVEPPSSGNPTTGGAGGGGKTTALSPGLTDTKGRGASAADSVNCRRCGSDSFRMRTDKAAPERDPGTRMTSKRIVECANCGMVA